MTIQQDSVPEGDVLAVLRGHPSALTVREVAEEFDTSYVAAQNSLRQLYMDGDAEYTRPTKINEDQRWRAADD